MNKKRRRTKLLCWYSLCYRMVSKVLTTLTTGPVATILLKGADAGFQPLTANRVELIFRSLRCSYLGNISIELQL